MPSNEGPDDKTPVAHPDNNSQPRTQQIWKILFRILNPLWEPEKSLIPDRWSNSL
jgi:hypothetical protein